MQGRSIAIALALSVVGCGGSVTKKDHAATAGGTSATGGAAAIGGSTTDMPGGATSVPLDDDTGSYPAVPAGSAAFFWRGGLGNWFITTFLDPVHDAAFSNEDGHKVWQASDERGVTVDLWAQLNHPAGTPVDLSDYSGIVFDARLVGKSDQIEVGFNANGNFTEAQGWLPEQQLTATGAWQTHALAFDTAGADAANISSIDFVVSGQDAPFELSIRNLALRCKAQCP